MSFPKIKILTNIIQQEYVIWYISYVSINPIQQNYLGERSPKNGIGSKSYKKQISTI